MTREYILVTRNDKKLSLYDKKIFEAIYEKISDNTRWCSWCNKICSVDERYCLNCDAQTEEIDE
jgi:hypothetical protein